MGQKPPSQIAAKRRASRVENIKRRAEAGEPHAQRAFVRLGRGTTDILVGKEDLRTWSDEELRRGQKKDKNGRFQGRAPNIVPKAVHDELVRRTLDEAGQMLRTNLVAAVEVLVDVMNGADVEPKDKLKAVQMIMDRVMGKAPEKIDVTIGEKKPWEDAVSVVIVGEEEDLADVIDVNFRETTDDDEEDDDPFGTEND